MTITAKVILDSINVYGDRLTTLQLRYPRFIHSELMTHRVFSRNASSSRAIPVERLIRDVMKDPAMPVHWGKNQPGMQANEEHNDLIFDYGLDNYNGLTREEAWFLARDNAVNVATRLSKAGYHKQIVNRLLEPFAHINVLVSSTDYDNFFILRDHKDAQPEIQQLARAMKWAINNSFPRSLVFGEWHLPYIDNAEEFDLETKKKISVARCASVSYKTVDGNPMTAEKSLEIFNKLYIAKPFHASPFEHTAQADTKIKTQEKESWMNPNEHGNFTGWRQYRKQLESKIDF